VSLSFKVDATDALKTLNAVAKMDAKAYLDLRAKVAHKTARVIRNEARKIYRTGVPGHAPLHPFTVEQKGGSHPLVEEGELWRSVEVFAVQGRRSEYVIGVEEGPQGIKAAVLEYGLVLKVTPARRAYLASRGLILRKDTAALVIPPRPVFPTALEEALPKIRLEVMKILHEFVSRRITDKQADGLFANMMGRFRRRFGDG